MKKSFIFGLLAASLIFVFSAPLKAQNAETLTITTYYPSPMGVYQNLRLFPVATAPLSACDSADEEGIIYYNNAAGQNQLMICRETAPLTFNWQPVGGGFWGLSGNNLTANETAWNIGIGTTAPDYKLSVSDTIHSAKALTPAEGNETNVLRSDAKLLFYDSGAINWAGFGVDAAGDVWLKTGTVGNNLSVFNANGNVGLGVANPHAKLEVNDTLLLTPRGSDPAIATEGTIYYNNNASINGFKYYNGSIWKDFSGNAEVYVRSA
ncbi:MAG: hypothetical protein WC412_04250, partial [Candidatus Omnitrophota bacterium]